VKADLAAFLFHTDDAVNFVGGEQMAMFGVTKTHTLGNGSASKFG
jgi:hypothetical protein